MCFATSRDRVKEIEIVFIFFCVLNACQGYLLIFYILKVGVQNGIWETSFIFYDLWAIENKCFISSFALSSEHYVYQGNMKEVQGPVSRLHVFSFLSFLEWSEILLKNGDWNVSKHVAFS